MKAIKILAMAALATAVFASCSSEDELAQSNYPMDNVVRIMTSVDGMNTRASYGNSTDKLNSFGFCIKNANSETYTYDNVKVTKELFICQVLFTSLFNSILQLWTLLIIQTFQLKLYHY